MKKILALLCLVSIVFAGDHFFNPAPLEAPNFQLPKNYFNFNTPKMSDDEYRQRKNTYDDDWSSSTEERSYYYNVEGFNTLNGEIVIDGLIQTRGRTGVGTIMGTNGNLKAVEVMWTNKGVVEAIDVEGNIYELYTR
ncbi:hypothetical protein CDOMC_1194 [Campylobacter sp. RM16192]|nr:hypothetical protein CDOMC_1194 [Campylobacter sp. RM16192]